VNRKVFAVVCMSVVLAVGALSTVTVQTQSGEGSVVQALVEGCFRGRCRPRPVNPTPPDRGNLDLENETVPPPPAPPAIAAVADDTTGGVALVVAGLVVGGTAGVARGWKNQHST
jgi:hypothetical protein